MEELSMEVVGTYLSLVAPEFIQDLGATRATHITCIVFFDAKFWALHYVFGVPRAHFDVFLPSIRIGLGLPTHINREDF